MWHSRPRLWALGFWLLAFEEDDPKTGAEFWAKHAEPWPNFHDSDGEIQRAFAPGGIPEFVLIDASGQITYASSGLDEPALRAAIAKLGPGFASISDSTK